MFEDGTGHCPWHHKDSSFTPVRVIGYASPRYRASTLPSHGDPDESVWTGLKILECLYCKKTIILLTHNARLPTETDADQLRTWTTVAFPGTAPRELAPSVPQTIRSLYTEASRCEQAAAYRAAAVMYRATVEELVKDQNAQGSTLYDKITSLTGKLPDDLITDLHEARMTGNDSIHDGLTYSTDEISDIANLIEDATTELYVLPEQQRQMRTARKARRDAAKNTKKTT